MAFDLNPSAMLKYTQGFKCRLCCDICLSLCMLMAVTASVSLTPSMTVADEVTPAGGASNGDASNGSDLKRADATISLGQIEPSFVSNRLADRGPLRLRLSLGVKIKNQGETDLDVRSEDFSLLIDDKPAMRGSFSSGPELKGSLQKGGELEGWLWYTDIENVAAEPKVILQWSLGQHVVRLSLNEEIRRLSAFVPETKGPDSSLAVVSTERNLDFVSTWVLPDLMEKIRQKGIRRLVILSQSSVPLQISEEAIQWLHRQTLTPVVVRSEAANTANRSDTAPVPFLEIHTAGLLRSPERRMPGRSERVVVHNTSDDAVTAALLSAYASADVELAMGDISSDDRGVRRAAIAACGDRLSHAQSKVYLSLLKSSVPERQSELIEPMYAMTDAGVPPLLRELSLASNEAVSLSALTALTKSVRPGVEDLLHEIWAEGETNPQLRSRIVRAALNSRDFRWADFLSAYLQEMLHRYARSGDAVGETGDPKSADRVPKAESSDGSREAPSVLAEKPADSPPNKVEIPPPAKVPEEPAEDEIVAKADARKRRIAKEAVNTANAEAVPLREVMTFLRQHKHSASLDAARAALLSIEDPAIQDMIVDFLMQWRSDSDSELLRMYLARRLETGQITDIVRQTASHYPDPRWTPALLKDFQKSGNQSITQRKTLSAILRGASGEQLDEVVDQFESMDVQSQSLILNHLAAIEHPQWRSVAQESLKKRSVLMREALDVLQQDSSEESIRIQVQHLQQLLAAVPDEKTTLTDVARMELEHVISHTAGTLHPECQRILNRCLRHPDQRIRLHAGRAIAGARRRSPALSLLIEVRDLKQTQKFDEALAKSNECVALDPFLPEAWLYRASLLLRSDRLEEAMQDLKRADELSPEELSTLSTIGLVMVRQGKLQEGLKLANETLQLDPKEESNLYNAACVYGRASELKGISSDERKQYADEAMRLLKQSVGAGFSDVPHLKNDPDLNCLHDHDEWQEAIASTDKNFQERQKEEKAPE